jgi:hypothetical protein
MRPGYKQVARLALGVIRCLHFLTSVAVIAAWEVVVLTLFTYPATVRELKAILLFFFGLLLNCRLLRNILTR